jgi:hypothetical protein
MPTFLKQGCWLFVLDLDVPVVVMACLEVARQAFYFRGCLGPQTVQPTGHQVGNDRGKAARDFTQAYSKGNSRSR